MIPIADENPVRKVPWVTLGLIAACIAAYFAVQPSRVIRLDENGVGERVTRDDLRFVVENAAIPCELIRGRPLTHDEYVNTFVFGDTSSCDASDHGAAENLGKLVYLGILTTMFLHASIPHLFGNLLFLWVFGNNIEDRRGRLRYLALYVFGGIVATFAHVAVDPSSTIPIVGASGAIAAVMGAYLVCYPSARIKTLVFFGFVFLRKIKAAWLLVLWFATQFIYVFSDSGVAWAAHAGGFVFGAMVGGYWRWQDRRATRSLPPAMASSGEASLAQAR